LLDGHLVFKGLNHIAHFLFQLKMGQFRITLIADPMQGFLVCFRERDPLIATLATYRVGTSLAVELVL
jgi:hypothetical protein